MNKCFFVLFLLFSLSGYAQTPGDFLVGTQLDLIKSDNDGFFEKAQVGLDVNYFFSESFTVTAGVEVWTRDGASAVVGGRWYPIPDAFIRIRGLIGENDVALGGGWAKPITENLRFEAMTDFYFAGNFTIRAGLAYIIKSN